VRGERGGREYKRERKREEQAERMSGEEKRNSE
jgi:hypothetical protein